MALDTPHWFAHGREDGSTLWLIDSISSYVYRAQFSYEQAASCFSNEDFVMAAS